jgi:protein-tyrosine-phosphatase
MAEGLLRSVLAPRALARTQILSAGTGALAGLPASDHSITACADEGVDIAAHRSRPLTVPLIEESDLLLVMEAHHRTAVTRIVPQAAAKTHLLGAYASSDNAGAGVDDPIGGDLEDYRVTFRNIRELITKALPRLEREILGAHGEA